MILALLLAAFPPCTPATAGQTYTDTAGQVWVCTGTYWAKQAFDAGVFVAIQGTVPWVVTGGGGSGSSVVTVDGGSVAISNLPAQWTIIDGGTVNVGNFPATQPVSGTVTVSGYVPPDGGVNVNNFPSSQAVTGTFWPNLQVVLIDAGTVDARVTSLPAVVLDGGVNISALPAVVIDGGVNVSALPAVVIDGGVNISALPAVVIDGGVNISSLPAVVIDGGINISALPAVVIDGGVNVSNLPAQWTTLDGGYSVHQGVDPQGQLHAVLTDTTGALYAAPVRPLPLPRCNPVRRYNCQ